MRKHVKVSHDASLRGALPASEGRIPALVVRGLERERES